jgi:hypothetical protein
MSRKKLLWIGTSGFSGKLRSGIENAILTVLERLGSVVKPKKLRKKSGDFVNVSIA